MSVTLEKVSGMPDGFRTSRRRSEAELLTYEEAAVGKTRKYIQRLSLNEDAVEELCSKYVNIGLRQSFDESSSAEVFATPPQNLPPRRSSLSVLEESHLNKAMNFGAFESEAEKARKARRKSFDKFRKRSTDEEKRSKKDRKAS